MIICYINHEFCSFIKTPKILDTSLIQQAYLKKKIEGFTDEEFPCNELSFEARRKLRKAMEQSNSVTLPQVVEKIIVFRW